MSVHLAEGFQRRRLKCEKLTDDGCQVMAKAVFGLVKREVIYFFTLDKRKTISLTCICCKLLKHIVVCNINMTFYTPFNMDFANLDLAKVNL